MAAGGSCATAPGELVLLVSPLYVDREAYVRVVLGPRTQGTRVCPSEVFASEGGVGVCPKLGPLGRRVRSGGRLSLRGLVNHVKDVLAAGRTVLLDEPEPGRRAAFVRLKDKVRGLVVRMVALDPVGGRPQLLWQAGLGVGACADTAVAALSPWYGGRQRGSTVALASDLAGPASSWAQAPRGLPREDVEGFGVLEVEAVPLTLPWASIDTSAALVLDGDAVFRVREKVPGVVSVSLLPEMAAALRVWARDLALASRIVVVVDEDALFGPRAVAVRRKARASLRGAMSKLASKVRCPVYMLVYTARGNGSGRGSGSGRGRGSGSGGGGGGAVSLLFRPSLGHALSVLHGRHRLDLDLVVVVSGSSARLEPVLALGIAGVLGRAFTDAVGDGGARGLAGVVQVRVGERPDWLRAPVYVGESADSRPQVCEYGRAASYGGSGGGRSSFVLDLDDSDDGGKSCALDDGGDAGRAALLAAYPLAPGPSERGREFVGEDWELCEGTQGRVQHFGVFPRGWTGDGRQLAAVPPQQQQWRRMQRLVWTYSSPVEHTRDAQWEYDSVHANGYRWDTVDLDEARVKAMGGPNGARALANGDHIAKHYMNRVSQLRTCGPNLSGQIMGSSAEPYATWIEFEFAGRPPHAPVGVASFGCSCPFAQKKVDKACKHVFALVKLKPQRVEKTTLDGDALPSVASGWDKLAAALQQAADLGPASMASMASMASLASSRGGSSLMATQVSMQASLPASFAVPPPVHVPPDAYAALDDLSATVVPQPAGNGPRRYVIETTGQYFLSEYDLYEESMRVIAAAQASRASAPGLSSGLSPVGGAAFASVPASPSPASPSPSPSPQQGLSVLDNEGGAASSPLPAPPLPASPLPASPLPVSPQQALSALDNEPDNEGDDEGGGESGDESDDDESSSSSSGLGLLLAKHGIV